MAIVYKITCKITGKIYIGWTSGCIKFRFSQHISENYKGFYLHRCIKKYKKENFTIQSLFEFYNEIDAMAKEIELIKNLKLNIYRHPNGIGMNMTDGGEGCLGRPGAWLGKKMSEETKQKMREASLGEKNHFYGKKHSKESREKISKSRKGIGHTEETKSKISANSSRWNKGKKLPPLSAVQRKKISNSLKGRPKSDEHRKNLSLANLGKKSSEETREKKRQYMTGRKRGKYKPRKKKDANL